MTDLQVSAQTVRLVVTSENEIDDTTVLSAVEEAGCSAVRSLMNAAGRLAVYCAGLAVAFVSASVAAGAVIPAPAPR